jgi:hypothetical protein
MYDDGIAAKHNGVGVQIEFHATVDHMRTITLLCLSLMQGRHASNLSNIGRNHSRCIRSNNLFRLTCSCNERTMLNCGNGRVASFLSGLLATAAAKGVASIVRDT